MLSKNTVWSLLEKHHQQRGRRRTEMLTKTEIRWLRYASPLYSKKKLQNMLKTHLYRRETLLPTRIITANTATRHGLSLISRIVNNLVPTVATVLADHVHRNHCHTRSITKVCTFITVRHYCNSCIFTHALSHAQHQLLTSSLRFQLDPYSSLSTRWAVRLWSFIDFCPSFPTFICSPTPFAHFNELPLGI